MKKTTRKSIALVSFCLFCLLLLSSFTVPVIACPPDPDCYYDSDCPPCYNCVSGECVYVGCPPGPFNLTNPSGSPTCQSASGVLLQWSQSEYASGYYIYVDTFSPPTTQRAQNVGKTNTSWNTNNWKTLEANKTYYWDIKAYGYGSPVKSSNGPWHFTTDGAPSEPTLQSPADESTCIDESSVTLVWDSVADANHYEVYLDTIDGKTTLKGTVESNSLEVTNLNQNTTYKWSIIAYNICGDGSSNDSVFEFTTVMTAGKATNPVVQGPSGDPNTIDAILYWTPGANTVSHNVYFDTDFNDVNDATTASAEYMGNVDVNHFDTRKILAFAWADSNMTTLTSLGQLASPDFNSWAEAFGLSGTGNIVGVSYDENFEPHAVIWEVNSVSGYDLSDLHTLGDANESVAYGISDSNWVVGRVDANAFLLKDIASPNMIKLAGLFSETDSNSVARSISNGTGSLEPVAVGWSGGHAAYWDNLDTNEPNVHDLGTVESYCYSRAYRINEYRQVVGYYWPMFDDPNHHTAFVGDLDNGLSSIGNLGSGNISRAYGINNAGQVVGEATTDSNDTTFNAFIYDGCQMYNINSLLQKDPCDSNDVVITSARSINDDGYIVGYGKIGDINDANNYDRALLLIPARPVAHWQFDQTTGTTVYDSSVKGNHGQLGNGPVWTSGKIRGALQFDGINDYVTTTMNGFTSSSQPRSVTVWINWDGSSAPDVIYGYGNNVAGEMFGLFVKSSGDLYFWGYNSADYDTGVNIETSEWIHLAITYDGTYVRTYKDSILAGTQEKTLDTVCDKSMIGRNVYISNDTFTGLIDDVRIYPYTLDINEITEIYQGQD